jgi:cytochrome P450
MKLILIMGMQRSGTTALFETLSTARTLVSHAESPDGPIYDDYFLRPEPAIRPLLRSSGSPVLLKPVRELTRRTLVSVIDEYAAYDLSIIWMYRDPVNVGFSYSVKGWLDATTAALQWIATNRMLILLPAAHRPKLTVLRYEELVSDGSVLASLRRKLGIRGHSTLRPDSNAGRAHLPMVIQSRIDVITSETLLGLLRFPTGLDSGRSSSWIRRATATPSRRSHLGEDRGEATPEARIASAAIDFARAAIDFESDGFRREPHACLRRVRESRRHHSESGHVHWLSGYDEVSCALHDSGRFIFQEGRLLKDGGAPGEERLRDAIAGAAIHDGTRSTAAGLEGLARDVFTRRAAVGQFNLADACGSAVAAMFHRMLGVRPGDPEGFLERTIRGESIHALSSHFLPGGWISRVAKQACLSSADLRRFLEFGSHYHHVTAIFALNAVHFLLRQPAAMNEVRGTPERFSAIFMELVRLAYPLLVVERWTNAAVEVAGRRIPAHHLIYLSIGAANRDPAAFERPDEFIMNREPATPRKPLAAYTGSCVARAHWEEWGHLACETLLEVVLMTFPLLDPVHPPDESKFTVMQSRGGQRQSLQIPCLRYLRTFEVKFRTWQPP